MNCDLGDLDNGVDHLAKAVAVCSQPQSLLSLFQQTLPPELFQEIIMRLPRVAQVYSSIVVNNLIFFFLVGYGCIVVFSSWW